MPADRLGRRLLRHPSLHPSRDEGSSHEYGSRTRSAARPGRAAEVRLSRTPRRPHPRHARPRPYHRVHEARSRRRRRAGRADEVREQGVRAVGGTDLRHLRGAGLARDLAVRGTAPDRQRRRRPRGVPGPSRTTAAGCCPSPASWWRSTTSALGETQRTDGRGASALRRRPRRQEARGAAEVRGRRIAGQTQQPPHPRCRQRRPAGVLPARPASRDSRSATGSRCANCR